MNSVKMWPLRRDSTASVERQGLLRSSSADDLDGNSSNNHSGEGGGDRPHLDGSDGDGRLAAAYTATSQSSVRRSMGGSAPTSSGRRGPRADAAGAEPQRGRGQRGGLARLRSKYSFLFGDEQDQQQQQQQSGGRRGSLGFGSDDEHNDSNRDSYGNDFDDDRDGEGEYDPDSDDYGGSGRRFHSRHSLDASLQQISSQGFRTLLDLGKRLGMAALTGKHDHKLDTFSGVFLPVVLSIWGVLIFLRLGFIIGQAGLISTIGLFSVGYAITSLTTLSLSAIATNGRVEGGGPYYMISRSLGPEFGGSIGFILWLSNVMSNGLNAIGFTEPFLGAFGAESGTFGKIFPEGKWWSFTYGSIVLIISTAVCLVGSQLFARTTILLFLLLTISTLSIMISLSFRSSYENTSIGVHFTGLSTATLMENLYANYTIDTTSGEMYSFATLFGVLFPACTGIMAGASMSGDLKSPSSSIPKGTLWAVATTYGLYIIISILIAASISRTTLVNDLTVLQDCCGSTGATLFIPSEYLHEELDLMKVNFVPELVILGAITTSVFSTLGAILGAAKLFQAMARDNLLPFISFFAVGTPENDEPIRAIFLTYFVSQLCLFIGDLNIVAPFVSIFCLLCYGVTNLACLLLDTSGSVNWRPRFEFFNWGHALAGTIASLLAMVFIGPLDSILSFLIMIGIFISIHYFTPPKPWGDVTQALIYHQVRKYLLRLDERKEHVKFWRPQILLFVRDPSKSLNIIAFCNSLKKGALYILGHVMEGDFRENLNDSVTRRSDLMSMIEKMRIKALVEVGIAPTFRQGVQNLLLNAGLGGMRPNIVILGFKEIGPKKPQPMSSHIILNAPPTSRNRSDSVGQYSFASGVSHTTLRTIKLTHRTDTQSHLDDPPVEGTDPLSPLLHVRDEHHWTSQASVHGDPLASAEARRNDAVGLSINTGPATNTDLPNNIDEAISIEKSMRTYSQSSEEGQRNGTDEKENEEAFERDPGRKAALIEYVHTLRDIALAGKSVCIARGFDSSSDISDDGDAEPSWLAPLMRMDPSLHDTLFPSPTRRRRSTFHSLSERVGDFFRNCLHRHRRHEAEPSSTSSRARQRGPDVSSSGGGAGRHESWLWTSSLPRIWPFSNRSTHSRSHGVGGGRGGARLFIDVWPLQVSGAGNLDTYATLLQLGCILSMVKQWKDHFQLRVHTVVEKFGHEGTDDARKKRESLVRLLRELRIRASVAVWALQDCPEYARCVETYSTRHRQEQSEAKTQQHLNGSSQFNGKKHDRHQRHHHRTPPTRARFCVDSVSQPSTAGVDVSVGSIGGDKDSDAAAAATTTTAAAATAAAAGAASTGALNTADSIASTKRTAASLTEAPPISIGEDHDESFAGEGKSFVSLQMPSVRSPRIGSSLYRDEATTTTTTSEAAGAAASNSRSSGTRATDSFEDHHDHHKSGSVSSNQASVRPDESRANDGGTDGNNEPQEAAVTFNDFEGIDQNRILNSVLRARSGNAAIILISLPAPPAAAGEYMDYWREIAQLTQDLPPTLLVHAKGMPLTLEL